MSASNLDERGHLWLSAARWHTYVASQVEFSQIWQGHVREFSLDNLVTVATVLSLIKALKQLVCLGIDRSAWCTPGKDK